MATGFISDTTSGSIYGESAARQLFFLTWKGDHSPGHVHVFRNGKLVVKCDLERGRVMKGRASRKLVEIIRQLDNEGEL